MRAATVTTFGGPEVLEIVEVPLPAPGPGQALIRVEAGAVNRIDLSTRSGALAQAGLLAPAERYWLGWDVAGTVEAIGPRPSRFAADPRANTAGPGANTAGPSANTTGPSANTTGSNASTVEPRPSRFAAGDAVIGLRDILSAPGTHAEYVVLDEAALAPAPTTVPPTAASTLPLIGLTADRSLTLTGLRAGQTLLVTGAAGGVGGLVLELARLRGIRTVAVADDDVPADHVVPRAEPLPAAVRAVVPGGVDAVIDAAVIGVPAHEALRGGGTFVALVAPFAPPPLRATRVVVQEVFADGARLAELSALVDAGFLTLRVADTLPLDKIATAHERLAAGALPGRLVLTP